MIITAVLPIKTITDAWRVITSLSSDVAALDDDIAIKPFDVWAAIISTDAHTAVFAAECIYGAAFDDDVPARLRICTPINILRVDRAADTCP